MVHINSQLKKELTWFHFQTVFCWQTILVISNVILFNKTLVYVIPVYNYCSVNIIVYLSAPILDKLHRADTGQTCHASPHVAWVLVQCHFGYWSKPRVNAYLMYILYYFGHSVWIRKTSLGIDGHPNTITHRLTCQRVSCLHYRPHFEVWTLIWI